MQITKKELLARAKAAKQLADKEQANYLQTHGDRFCLGFYRGVLNLTLNLLQMSETELEQL